MGKIKSRTFRDLYSENSYERDYFEEKILNKSRRCKYLRLIAAIILLVAGLASALSYTSVRIYNSTEIRERSTQAREIAKLTASMVEQEENPLNIRRTIEYVERGFSQVSYIYIYKMKGDKRQVLYGEAPNESRAKSLITATEPIYDKNGQKIAYASVEVSKADIESRTSLYMGHVVGSSLVFLLVTMVLGCYISIKYYVADNSRVLRIKAKQDKKLIREIAQAFAKTIDMRDNYTNGHSFRVADYTYKISRELGLDDEICERYYDVGLLHDVGKIGIPHRILRKAGMLTDGEFNTMKTHTILGYEALKNISIMPELADGARYHHERFDGKGYPDGLKGDDIPRVAQIISVADAFDAMYSDRPYRKHVRFDKAVNTIEENSGTQFSKDVVDAFIRLVERGELFNGTT